MKHGIFDASNELVDTDGTCADCGKPYTLFKPCDCDLKNLDDERAAKLGPDKISIAVVTTFEGNQGVVRTTSIAEVVEKSYYLGNFLEENPDARPVLGYQRPEPDYHFGEDEGISVNFFVVDIAEEKK